MLPYRVFQQMNILEEQLVAPIKGIGGPRGGGGKNESGSNAERITFIAHPLHGISYGETAPELQCYSRKVGAILGRLVLYNFEPVPTNSGIGIVRER